MSEYKTRIAIIATRTNLNVMPSGVGDIAYRRDDGIYVVPVGCLKP